MLKYLFIFLSAVFLLTMVSCTELQESVGSGTHPEKWLDSQSADFHGLSVLESIHGSNSCKSCHGEDFHGGTSKVSCFSCHQAYPHPDGFANENSPSFHVAAMPDVLWNIRTECASCHGSDYKGAGYDSKNCTECHTQVQGPETCNTCHGNDYNHAPPRDRYHNTDTLLVTVGAHQHHVPDTTNFDYSAEQCFTCHPSFTDFGDPLHLPAVDPDEAARIDFSGLAIAHDFEPEWLRNSATCGNIYCHGAFSFPRDSSANQWAYADSVITGNFADMDWTFQSSFTECETCHSMPPIGHIAGDDCNSCHPFSDETHINGKIDSNF